MAILGPLRFCLFNSLITFFLLLIPKIVLGQFSVIGPAGPIQASVGGETELPCYLSPPQSAQHMEVVWFQSTRVVHTYRDEEDHFGDQDPDYQGRTKLVRDAITSGNVTLKILDVRLLDAGKYTCLIADGFHQEEADMELNVLGEELESSTVLQETAFLTQLIIILVLLLLLQIVPVLVYFLRSFPLLNEVCGILTVTCAFEIEVILFILWLLLRCRGYFYMFSYWPLFGLFLWRFLSSMWFVKVKVYDTALTSSLR